MLAHLCHVIVLPTPKWRTLQVRSSPSRLCRRSSAALEPAGISRRRLSHPQPFALYTTAFGFGIYASIKVRVRPRPVARRVSRPARAQSLELTSVGVVIAARACLPLLVVLLEWLFMGRQLPNARSRLALLGVLACALVYVVEDSRLAVRTASGWAWLFVWWSLLAFQMTYGKHIAVALEMGQHERVLLTNALSLPPTLLLCLATGEARELRNAQVTEQGLGWLVLSWAIGLGISYSGWWLKELATATTFTLVGVLNKVATLGLSALAFPGSTTFRGFFSLLACIVCGLLYRDAPLKVSADTGLMKRMSSPRTGDGAGSSFADKISKGGMTSHHSSAELTRLQRPAGREVGPQGVWDDEESGAAVLQGTQQ